MRFPTFTRECLGLEPWKIHMKSFSTTLVLHLAVGLKEFDSLNRNEFSWRNGNIFTHSFLYLDIAVKLKTNLHLRVFLFYCSTTCDSSIESMNLQELNEMIYHSFLYLI